MSLAILGIGTSTPSHSIKQGEAAELAKKFCCGTEEQGQLLKTLYQRTRIKQRGSVLLKERAKLAPPDPFLLHPKKSPWGPTTRERMQRYAEEAPLLASTAARQALLNSKTEVSELKQLVTVSCTGFFAPGIDIALIKELDLGKTIGRTHIGFMGCHGGLNGLRVASALACAQPDSQILLCAVELCSLHFYYGWAPEKIVANGLFSDGAACLVLASDNEADRSAWKIRANGACLFPDSEDVMTWRIGDHGFEMMLSPQLPQLISQNLRPWLEEWLATFDLRLEEIRSWAIHPGGPRILSAVQESLSLSEETLKTSLEVFTEHGNMSSPTVFFIIQRLQKQNSERPCVALGFGPGLAAEAALIV